MKDKRQKAKRRRSEHTFAAKPHHIFRPDFKNATPCPTSVLSHKAAHLLDNLTAQLNGKNNGDLSAAPKIMKLSNRVATLNGGKIFAYRHCNHLAYESQREADHDCNASRAEKTRAKLDCGAGILYLNGRKPK